MPHPKLTDEQRERRARAAFWRKVQKGPGCWLWTGGKVGAGYGLHLVNYRHVLAHRYAYELVHGCLLPFVHVCHHCDNPACVRPSHMFLGTDKDNHADAKAKGRTVRGSRNGQSKLTKAQVLEILARAAGEGRPPLYMAVQLGISPNHINAIVRGARWGHLRSTT